MARNTGMKIKKYHVDGPVSQAINMI